MCSLSAEWINAIASVGAAIGTVTAVAVSLNYSQEEKKLRIDNEKKSQASKIAGWVGGVSPVSYDDEIQSTITIINKSELPIYNVVARPGIKLGKEHSKVDEHSQKQCAKIHLLPPGESIVLVSFIDSAMGGKAKMLEIGFQDSYGVNWKRRGDGILEEIPEEPFFYFGIERPFGANAFYDILPLSKKMDDDYRRVQFYINSLQRIYSNFKVVEFNDKEEFLYKGQIGFNVIIKRPNVFFLSPTNETINSLNEISSLMSLIERLQELVRSAVDSSVLREVVYLELNEIFKNIEKLQASITSTNTTNSKALEVASFSDFCFRYFRK